MAGGRRLLLLALGGGRSAAAAAAGLADAAALVQQSVEPHVLPLGAAIATFREAAEAPNASCECLGWADVYRYGGVRCGDGYEYDPVAPRGQKKMTGPELDRNDRLHTEFCLGFFKSLPNDNFCMNRRFEQDPTEWCYVSRHCEEGAKNQRGGPLRIKNCTQGRDRSFSDMKFQKLSAYARRHKLELSLTARFAFPTMYKLNEVQGLWGFEPEDWEPQKSELNATQTQRLLEKGKSMKALFYDSPSGSPPYGVSEAYALYKISANPYRPRTRLIDLDHKEELTYWACVANCHNASNFTQPER